MSGIAPDKLIWVVIFLVPGLVAKWFYSMRHPGDKREWEKILLELLAYSLFNSALWSWLLIPLAKTPPEQWEWWYVSLVGVVVCFISPAVLGMVWAWLRANWLHRRFGFDHPTARGWDYFLTHHRQFWVLFHLKNGKMLGGFFGERSYASTFPQEPEIYVEEVWRVNEIGQFVEKVPGTAGAVVRQNDWERVEFFEIKLEEQSAGQEQGDGGSERELPSASGRDGGSGSAGTGQPAGEANTPAGGFGDGTGPGQQQPNP
jgi:hypothetical protein